MRFNVASFPSVALEIERTFGSNNVFEDPPDSKFFYAWSAVEVNKDGNMAIVYTRSGTTIFPETRFSVFLAADPDIRSSRILKAGEDSYQVGFKWSDNSLPWGDEAGASVDPVDDTSIWLAQQFANSRHKNSGNGNYSVFVGKVTF
jgi:hypothetical protein